MGDENLPLESIDLVFFQGSVDSARTQTSGSSQTASMAQQPGQGFEDRQQLSGSATNQKRESTPRRFSYEIDPDIGVIVWDDALMWYSLQILSLTLSHLLSLSLSLTNFFLYGLPLLSLT